MKKLITVFTIMFAVVAMTFGQQTIANTTISVNGSSDGFEFAVNPDGTVLSGSGTMVITFHTPQNNVDFNYAYVTGGSTIEYFKYGENNDGIYMIKVIYGVLKNGSTNITTTGDYTMAQFITQDTVDAYTNGVNSVNTQSFYDNGFTAGVASVVCDVCDITQDNVDEAYNNGLADGADFSVNADDYQTGFEAGKSTCGTNGISMTSTDMGVNVYPNPVFNGEDVTITCPNFESVTVLTITGQVIDTYNDTSISTSNLTSGMYFLNVKDTNGNVSATKVLIK